MAEQDHEPAPVSPTPASEFRQMREQGEVITIPRTGRAVRLRAVKPAALLRLGKIPDPLSDLVVHMMYGKITQAEYDAFFEMEERREQALDLADSMQVVCTAALIEPRIVDDPQADDEIHIDDLEDSEQRYIFDLAMMEATRLSRFRLSQAPDVEPVAPEQEPALPAEPLAGHPQ